MQLPQIMTDFFDALSGKVVYPSENYSIRPQDCCKTE